LLGYNYSLLRYFEMQVSAEIRWFWKDTIPSGLKDWFCDKQNDSYVAGGGVKIRADQYLRDTRQNEMGIKLRGGKSGVEVKGLVSVISDQLAVGPFHGNIEVWTKWTTESLELPASSLVTTEKRRWLRKFDTSSADPSEIPLGEDEQPLHQQPVPAMGCNVELTQVTLGSANVWWTLGFESFGTIQTIEKSLRSTASILAARRPPDFISGFAASYPAWLKDLQI
jgi:hypothetical protein